MKVSIEYQTNKSSPTDIAEHLYCCDLDFVPPLSRRVEIRGYAQKLTSKAMRFEAWSGGILVGLVAVYCNDEKRHIAYLTSVSVLRSWTSRGIAARLLAECINYTKALGMRKMSLQVARENKRACLLYEKSGFLAGKQDGNFITMNLYFNKKEEYE